MIINVLISWAWFDNFAKLESNVPGKGVDEVVDDNVDDDSDDEAKNRH